MFHVVDDEDYVREIVTAMIKAQGHTSMAFGSPDEYISFAKSIDFIDPVAVFTDVKMPGMTGYKMMNCISELKPGLKFVVMTPELEIESAYAMKACMYLRKPFKMDTLTKIVDTLIRCHISSPSDDHGCAQVNSRERISLGTWRCPHRSMNCSPACR